MRYIKCDRETLFFKKGKKSQLSQNLWQDLVTSVSSEAAVDLLEITLHWQTKRDLTLCEEISAGRESKI